MDMMITGIEDHPKGKGRVRIFMNNEFAFVLYKGELSQYGIECGVTVTDTLYDRIMQETVFPRARKRAMNLLMNIDRTEADVRRRLSRIILRRLSTMQLPMSCLSDISMIRDTPRNL